MPSMWELCVRVISVSYAKLSDTSYPYYENQTEHIHSVAYLRLHKVQSLLKHLVCAKSDSSRIFKSDFWQNSSVAKEPKSETVKL